MAGRRRAIKRTLTNVKRKEAFMNNVIDFTKFSLAMALGSGLDDYHREDETLEPDDDETQDDDLGDEDEGDDSLEDDEDEDEQGSEVDPNNPDAAAQKQGKQKEQTEVKVYTEEQVNATVKGRLARAERTFQKDLSVQAGTQLESHEPVEAVKLWGFMKLNPEVSRAVQNVVDNFIATGKAVMPQKAAPATDALSLREAVIDLKEQDTFFAKNSKAILEWADDNGYDISDEKTLNLAYLAWKGANAPQQVAKAKLEAQQKATQKQKAKQGAALEGGRAPRKSGTKINYGKATPQQILQHEGLSLFTED